MLYKYVPPDRIGILLKGLIRFTQPGDFNDPFELNPSFDLMSKADIAALPEAPGEPGPNGQRARILTPEAMAAMFSAVLPGIQRQMAKYEGTDGTYALQNNLIAQGTFDSKIGILSLSEVPDSLPMWAHYAQNHQGFVIQLDETHEFFASTICDGLSLPLARVEYSANRPILSYSNLNTPVIYYKKSLDWSYEREWRAIKLLSGAAEVISRGAYPCCLFELPPSAIKGVIIGCATPQVERDALIALPSEPRLKHIEIHQTRLSNNDYRLEIYPPIDGKPYPGMGVATICEAR